MVPTRAIAHAPTNMGFVMTVKRKTKSDTTQGLITAGHGQLVEWPIVAVKQHPRHQADCEHIFSEVLETRPRESWSGPQINMAANYAITIVEHREIMGQLTAMGWVSENKRGTAVINPLAHVAQQLSGEIIRLANKLKLAASDDPRVIASQTGIGNRAQARLVEVAKDDVATVDWTQVAS